MCVEKKIYPRLIDVFSLSRVNTRRLFSRIYSTYRDLRFRRDYAGHHSLAKVGNDVAITHAIIISEAIFPLFFSLSLSLDFTYAFNRIRMIDGKWQVNHLGSYRKSYDTRVIRIITQWVCATYVAYACLQK